MKTSSRREQLSHSFLTLQPKHEHLSLKNVYIYAFSLLNAQIAQDNALFPSVVSQGSSIYGVIWGF